MRDCEGGEAEVCEEGPIIVCQSERCGGGEGRLKCIFAFGFGVAEL